MTKPAPTLLRVEAVNLGNFVYDTARLPTIRGGSRLLLEAVDAVEEWLGNEVKPGKVEAISRGASTGLFRLTTGDAGKLRTDLESWLGRHEEFRHATFVVDVVAETPTDPATPEILPFRGDVERLIALNRFRQMRAPSLAIPSGTAKLPCLIDRVRPGSKTRTAPGGEGTEWLSESVAVRTDHGRKAKQDFYERETGRPWNLAFAQDFQELAADGSRGKLDGKMAVLYLDGNHFGSLQRDLCKSPEKQKAFDQHLRELRRGFLTALLEGIMADPGGWKIELTKQEEAKDPSLEWKIRLETLLWGGDDLLLVAPAWKGFRLAELFFTISRGWQFASRPLRHAGGLVLCHSNAPIRRIKRLAENLAEVAKKVDRERNLLAYQVLESFDLVGSEFEAFRAARSPGGAAPKELVLAGDGLGPLRKAVAALKPFLPHGRVHRVAQKLLSDAAAPSEERKALRELAQQETGGDPVADLEAAAATPAAGWLHLVELWDYLEEAGS